MSSHSPSSKKKSYWGFVLRSTVSFLALIGLVYAVRGKLGEAFFILKTGVQWEWFFGGVALYCIAVGIVSARLRLILEIQKVEVSFTQAYYLSFIGLFFNLFFPSAVGGDIAKAYFAYQYSHKKLGSLTAVFLDRFLGFFALAAIAVAAFLAYSRSLFDMPLVKQSLFMVVGVLIFAVLFFGSRRFAKKFSFLWFLVPSSSWRDRLSDFYHAIRECRHHKKVTLVCLVLSLIGQISFMSTVYLLILGLGEAVDLRPFFLLMPLVSVVSMAPSLSGLGVREAGFVFFFKSIMPIEQAFALSLLHDLIYYGVAVGGGIWFAFAGGLKKGILNELQAAEAMPEKKVSRHG